MPPSSTPEDSKPRSKRTSACLHCRRMKLKCDGGPDKPCTRCVQDDVECIIRPRANAAIVVDDLRWQQSVEARLKAMTSEIDHLRAMTREIEQIKAANANLVRQIARGDGSSSGHTPLSPLIPTRAEREMPRPLLPHHLLGLRDILQPVMNDLQRSDPIDVSIDDATVLWEFFYDSLAIFHGFTASTDLATPSPMLFSSVVTAAAYRYPGRLGTPVESFEDLFKRALIRLMYQTMPKTWDDTVALGIARTWFWKADEITAGLIYGSFVETITANQNDFRDRRVWDFLEMTTVSHGLLHLSTPIVPDKPPRGVPDRRPSHLLVMALNELFDSLGLLNRALVNARSLVNWSLTGQPPPRPLSFAEIVVLRGCRGDLDRWRPKWLVEIQNADTTKLPTGAGREFLLDLVTLYYHVACVVVDGYLAQTGSPGERAAFEHSARELLQLVTGRWAESLHLWPKLFLHSTMIAAIALPPDELAQRTHALILHSPVVAQSTGSKLANKLGERIAGEGKPFETVPVFTARDLQMPVAPMAYTGSDSFWADLSGVLGLPPDAEIVPDETAWRPTAPPGWDQSGPPVRDLR